MAAPNWLGYSPTTCYCLLLFIAASLAPATHASMPTGSGWYPASGKLPQATALSSVLLHQGKLFSVGGCADTACENGTTTITSLDLRTQSISLNCPVLPSPIVGHMAATSVGDYIYVLGMCTFYNPYKVQHSPELYQAIWQLDPTGQRTTTATMATVWRANSSCVAFRGSIYIIGGVNLTTLNLTTMVDRYDPATDEYHAGVFEHEHAVSNPGVGSDDTAIYIVGGRNASHMVATDAVAVFPRKNTKFQRINDVPQDLRGADLMRVIAFGNKLILTAFDFSTTYQLNLKFASMGAQWENIALQSAGLTLSGLIAVPVPNNVLGSSLTLYAFGGVAYNSELAFSQTSHLLDTILVNVVNSISVPRPILELHGVGFMEKQWINITMSQSITGGYVRLSEHVDCQGNAVGTNNFLWYGTEVVSFFPQAPSNAVYLCYSAGSTIFGDTVAWFYIVTNPANPIIIWPTPTPAPPPPPLTRWVLPVAVSISCALAITAGLAAVFLRRKRRNGSATRYMQGIVRATADSRYTVESKLGEGAFSEVYLVSRKSDGDQFALKYMECGGNKERLDAIKECETINSLQGHPGVITIIDMFMNYEFQSGRRGTHVGSGDMRSASNGSGKGSNGTSTPLLLQPRGSLPQAGARDSHLTNESHEETYDRYLCLIMDYHPQGDLARWVLGYRESPSEVLLCSIALQLCNALKFMHSLSPPVIHRDLKPENVLIGAPLNAAKTYFPVVLTDFGLALIQVEARRHSRGAGTRPYVAPESWRGHVTTKCDLWSLGCVLYALATKRVTMDCVRIMFQDARVSGFHSEIQSDLLALGLSRQFCATVVALLKVDPAERPTAEETFQMFTASNAGGDALALVGDIDEISR